MQLIPPFSPQYANSAHLPHPILFCMEVLSQPKFAPLPKPSQEQWEGQLASSYLEDQLELIYQAQLAACAQDVLY